MPTITEQVEILRVCMCKLVGSAAKDWNWSDLETWGTGKKKLEKDYSERREISELVDRKVKGYILEHDLSNDSYETVLEEILENDLELKTKYYQSRR